MFTVKSGSFVYDVELGVDSWAPRPSELRVLSAEMIKLAFEEAPFERLSISQELAEELFQDNKYKLEQIPSIVHQSLGNWIQLLTDWPCGQVPNKPQQKVVYLYVLILLSFFFFFLKINFI